jgi:regulator of replication initiation timing
MSDFITNAELRIEAERLCDENERLRAENAKLRECLQDFADAIKNDDGFGVDRGWMLERMSEIGIRGQ